MSKKTPLATARKTLFALGIAALLSAAADAADPNTPARKEKAKAPAASLPTRPTSKPKPPALRSPASFTPQTTLGEAIDILRTSTTPPLNIIVLWRPLGDAGVYRDTPIGIDGVAGLRVNRCLELLTLSLSAGASARIGYTVNNGIITISTIDALPAPRSVTRVYDISDLVALPGRYSLPSMGFGVGYGGQMAPWGGVAGNPSRGLSSPISSTSRAAPRPSPRNNRRR